MQEGHGAVALVTTEMVIAEIVWTLESYYALDKPTIHDHVLAILNTPGLEIAGADRLLQAMAWYAEHNIDVIDAYHAVWSIDASVSGIFTFDTKHFRRIRGLDVRRPG